mmetsp:Transcript_17817/g.36194  ORF Transcript_17817/g.36194 Transcript_17817/m.36194 type:complete len:83 (+) Transcript_17817:565-813(+)
MQGETIPPDGGEREKRERRARGLEACPEEERERVTVREKYSSNCNAGMGEGKETGKNEKKEAPTGSRFIHPGSPTPSLSSFL